MRFGAGSLARPDLSTGLRHANTYNGLMVRSWSLVGCTRGPRACALRRRRSGQRSDIGLVKISSVCKNAASMGRKETRYIDSGLAAAIPWTLFDDARVLATPQAARDLSDTDCAHCLRNPPRRAGDLWANRYVRRLIPTTLVCPGHWPSATQSARCPRCAGHLPAGQFKYQTDTNARAYWARHPRLGISRSYEQRRPGHQIAIFCH